MPSTVAHKTDRGINGTVCRTIQGLWALYLNASNFDSNCSYCVVIKCVNEWPSQQQSERFFKHVNITEILLCNQY